MFLLPALLLPLVLGLAVYRLYQIPRRLMSGELKVQPRRRWLWLAAAAVAYGGLLICTLALIGALIDVLVAEGNRLEAYRSVVGYLLGYPVAYVAAAWTFHYALIPVARTDH